MAEPRIRPARLSDAADLARLIDMAGHGLPMHRWASNAENGEAPLDVGIRWVSADEGAFSWRWTSVVDNGSGPAAMSMGYAIGDARETGSLDELAPEVRPLAELKDLATGTWHLNWLATRPDCRGKGLGSLLLGHAETIADDTGCRRMSVIVTEQDGGAYALYVRSGYEPVARRPFVGFSGSETRGDWVLMIKSLSEHKKSGRRLMGIGQKLWVLPAAACMAVLPAVCAHAALPPEYDRLRQFAAVADAGDVATALAEHGLVDRIERQDDGSFRAWAGKCYVTVTLTALPPEQGMVGPTRYEASVGTADCE